ncbi:hypothetical protein Bca101_065166 [Brassica carinata]
MHSSHLSYSPATLSFASLWSLFSRYTKGDRPSILVDESWPCDLSVINGSDSPRSLRTVEDRYPVRS